MTSLFDPVSLAYAAVFLPLVGFIIVGGIKCFAQATFFTDKMSEVLTCSLMLLAATSSILLFNHVALMGNDFTHILFPWIVAGDFTLNWALRFDTLSVVMICVVNIVSACVHVYSVGYMHHDKSRARFMAYLGLFTFMMLMLVTSDNLVQLFFGWEGVGVASYLLIGFWHHKDSANKASIKAFLVNRVGDMGLALGVFTLFMLAGSINFDVLFADPAALAEQSFLFFGYDIHGLTLACILLFIGAMGKSAQLGLHTWLPDAMEGPTPVSALIHAATMVTAGVFLVARMSPLFEYAPMALAVVAVLGALTAFIAATIGLTQFDIKRVIAYSTMSQLGYMFFALGVSAYGAAIFHLVTHAFFKALLFLGAGSVIHAMSDEQDMRNMGGIWKKIPVTYVMMWIGSLALAGIPYFAGYFSKDMILEAAFADHSTIGYFAYGMGVAAAFLTAFYSWRLIYMTFHGKPRADEKVMDHVHESPFIMLLPLGILAAGALFAGYLGYDYFVGDGRADFWRDALFILPANDTVGAAHHIPAWAVQLILAVAVSGIVFATLYYMIATRLPEITAKIFKPLHTLFFNKWYFDEIYDVLFVKPASAIGRFLWTSGDQKIIDGLGPNGFAKLSHWGGRMFSKIQTGLVYHYAFAMIIGLIVLIGYLMIQRGVL